MGEYAELQLELTERTFLGKARCKPQLAWETKDGKQIDIFNMSTSHIQNSLAKCLQDDWREEFIPLFQKELKSRGVTK